MTMMKIEDMADLIAMYDTQASADKIICLATGEDTISALEYAGSGLFGNYMKLEKMIERNCCDRIRNASIRDGLPTWAVILTNRELTTEDRAAILLGYDGSFFIDG